MPHPLVVRTATYILIAIALAAAPAGAAERLDAKIWRRAKTYDMRALQKLEPLPLRQIVGVRFSITATLPFGI